MSNTMIEEQKLIVLFGATGQTGKKLLPLLLDAGYRVRAIVRDPKKVQLSHQNLELVTGDIQNLNQITEMIKGAYGIISLVGSPLGNRHYKGGLLLPFIKAVHEAMLAQGIKHLLVQSGAVAKSSADSYSFFKHAVLRQVLSRLSADHGIHKDNDAVLAYLEKRARDIAWIVTRPPKLVDNPQDKQKVIGMDDMPFPPKISFQSLTAYTLNALEDDSLTHTAKYCGYEK